MAFEGLRRTLWAVLGAALVAGCQPAGVPVSPPSLGELVERSLAQGERVIHLPQGVYLADRPIVVSRSGVEIVGVGDVLVHSRIRGEDAALFFFRGDQGRRLGSTAGPLRRGEKAFRLSSLPRDASGLRWVLLRYPNTEDFFDAIGSEVWRQDQPYLRHGIYQVEEVAGDRVVLSKEVEIDYPPGTEVWAPNLVRDVALRNLTIFQEVPGAEPGSVSFVYENRHPQYAVDAVRMKYVADAVVEGVRVRMAGRHVFSCEFCFNVRVQGFRGEGSWNKGGGGNGYFQVSKTYESLFTQVSLEGIRHLTIQWMSSRNLFSHLDLRVDVNFHGGYTRYNTVRGCRIAIPKEHPWPPVVRTPKDARWAPPDGEGNLVEDCQMTQER
ncbi:hypothetical protein [Thermus thermophilus]|uniref:hypothetical protein n=1 Tax=Thermus thermophilus TaxID=274 RepID=UPI001FCDDF3D|nr:hypothetical protein [Thermus thermophilus]BDG22751.1 hypothetical protein TthSNM17_24130 [Thermus thermophilus]